MDSYLFGNILAQTEAFDVSKKSHRYVDVWVTEGRQTLVDGELQDDEIASWVQKVRVAQGAGFG